jgi:hypothetical protein
VLLAAALVTGLGLLAAALRRPPGEPRDLPLVSLRAVASTLPPSRSGWGDAMLAELEILPAGARRWSFCLGCAWAVGIDQARRPVGRHEPGSGFRGLVLAAIAASLGSVAFGLARYPGLRESAATWPVVAVYLALLLGYAALAVLLSRQSGTDATASRRVGLVTGLATGTSWFAVWQSVSFLPIFAALLAPVIAATWLAWTRRSTAAGAWAALWGGLSSGLVFFMGVSVASYMSDGRPYDRYVIAEYHRSAAPNLATYAVGDNLSSAIVMLLALPVLAVAFGALGAWLATHPKRSPR